MSYKIVYKCDRCGKDNISNDYTIGVDKTFHYKEYLLCGGCYKDLKKWFGNINE